MSRIEIVFAVTIWLITGAATWYVWQAEQAAKDLLLIISEYKKLVEHR